MAGYLSLSLSSSGVAPLEPSVSIFLFDTFQLPLIRNSTLSLVDTLGWIYKYLSLWTPQTFPE